MNLIGLSKIIVEFTSKYAIFALIITFASIIILFLLNFRDIKNRFEKINKGVWFLLGLIFIVGLYLRFSVNECEAIRGTLWYFIFTAKSMLEKGEVLVVGYYPLGYSFMLMLTFYFFGISYESVTLYNVFFSSLSSVVIFLITYKICKNNYASLLAALIFSLFPQSMLFSKSGTDVVSAMFWESLSFLLLILSLKIKTQKIYALTFMVLLFSIIVEIENIIFIGLFLLTYLIFLKRNELSRLILPLGIFSIFMTQLTAFFILAPVSFGFYNICGSSYCKRNLEEDTQPGIKEIRSRYPFLDFDLPTFSVIYLPLNFSEFIKEGANEEKYPLLLYPLAFISILGIRKYPKIIVLILWISSTLLFYGLYWDTSIGDVVYRYFSIIPALTILTGIGLLILFRHIRKFMVIQTNHELNNFINIGLVMLIVILFIVSISRTNLIGLIEKSQSEIKCLSKDILSASQILEENSCILVEKYFKWNAFSNQFDITAFLLRNNEIENNLSKCLYKDKYYFKLNEKLKNEDARFDQNKSTYYIIEKNCNVTLLKEYWYLNVYRVYC